MQRNIFEDEEEKTPNQNELASINEMVSKAMVLSAHIETLEAALKAAEKELRQIVEKDLVERLTAAGTMAFVTDTGLSVKIEKGLYVSELKTPSLRRDLMDRRAEWLRQHGGDSLIQENVEMVFDESSHGRAEKVMKMLTQLGYDFVHGNSINSGSFKSFVTDVMHEEDVPLAYLGLYQKTEAVIKLPQERKSRRK